MATSAAAEPGVGAVMELLETRYRHLDDEALVGGLGAVLVAQSTPPKPMAQTQTPSRHRPLPAHPIRQARASQCAPVYPGAQPDS